MQKPAESIRVGDILAGGHLVTSTPWVNDQQGVTFTVILNNGDLQTVSRMVGDLMRVSYDSATDRFAA